MKSLTNCDLLHRIARKYKLGDHDNAADDHRIYNEFLQGLMIALHFKNERGRWVYIVGPTEGLVCGIRCGQPPDVIRLSVRNDCVTLIVGYARSVDNVC